MTEKLTKMADRAMELFEQKSPHQLAVELVAMQEQRDQLRLRVDELLGQRNATGLAIDGAILSGIVPEQHPLRSRLEMLANHRKSKQELAAKVVEVFAQRGSLAVKLSAATKQFGAMSELLDELRPCLVEAWASDGHASRYDQYHNELLERIDALLAGGEA